MFWERSSCHCKYQEFIPLFFLAFRGSVVDRIMVPGFFMPTWLSASENPGPRGSGEHLWLAILCAGHHMICLKERSTDLRLHWGRPRGSLCLLSPGLYPLHLSPLRILISRFSWQYTIKVIMTAFQTSVSLRTWQSSWGPPTHVSRRVSVYTSQNARDFISVWSQSPSLFPFPKPISQVFPRFIFSLSPSSPFPHNIRSFCWSDGQNYSHLFSLDVNHTLIIFFNIHFFIWSCSMWNLRLRIKRASPALEVWSPHQWTAREAPYFDSFYNNTTKWGF